MKKFYTLLDHTTDLRIRIIGDSQAALLRNAGLALADLIDLRGEYAHSRGDAKHRY